MRKWVRMNYHPMQPLGPNGTRITNSKAHQQLARKLARAGMVLLKNDDRVLPLTSGVRIALFGKNQVDYVKGGGGSANVVAPYTHSLYDGMLEKQQAQRCTVFAPLSKFYQEQVAKQYEAGAVIGRTTEPAVPEDLVADAARFTDTAIISIGRYSGEGADRPVAVGDGDYYLSAEEETLVKAVIAHFAKVIVVLNVGGMVDTSWFKDNPQIQSVLLAWQGGQEGGTAAADLLFGDADPSGKLPDTLASSAAAYPGSEHFNDSEEYVDYTEDIYVGYRYFETLPNKQELVNYPFGFGLSYTTFALSGVQAQEQNNLVTVSVSVLNTGSRAGQETVQLYLEAPQGKLGKPSKVLAAFVKTRLLAPGEAQVVTLKCLVDDFASFDDLGAIQRSAFVLEAGDYHFALGTSVEATEEVALVHHESKDRIVRQAASRVAPHRLAKRLLANGTYQKLPTDATEKTAVNKDAVHDAYFKPLDLTLPLTQQRRLKPVKSTRAEDVNDPSEPGLNLLDVYQGRGTLDELTGQMTNGELATLLSGIHVQQAVTNTGGFAKMPQHGIPEVVTSDGPGGIRVEKNIGMSATSWPCETLLASTWDPALLHEYGNAIALEMKENNLQVWLAPAMNIHRDPRCGRNFEYFSEDPLLNGLCGSAEVEGIQAQHIGAVIKHFACNNKETNRLESDSRVSERALRELYLKPFEIAVKQAHPWAVMSSYNMINEEYNSQDKELLDGILRSEWGFDGLVMTDWWNRAFQTKEVLAGNDLKMADGEPGSLIAALADGTLTREDLERSAKRILALVLKLD